MSFSSITGERMGGNAVSGFKTDDERKKHGSLTFYKLLEEMAETHDKKSHDYASNSSPYGNYHFAGQMANLFNHSPHDAGFAGRLAEKMYRLANLEGGQKLPQNESIEDTERDIAVIAALWMSDRRDRRITPNPLQTGFLDAVKVMDNQQLKLLLHMIAGVLDSRDKGFKSIEMLEQMEKDRLHYGGGPFINED